MEEPMVATQKKEKKLDTRMIEMVGSHPNKDAIRRMDRIKETEKARREEQVAKAWNLVRLGLSGICAWFAIWHVDVITRNFMTILEAVGVVACIGFISSTVSDIWEEAGKQ